jgi:lipid II:glycine glycyltransferase (peptidoglycan interpeptide bridge formation enzyme)
MILYDRAISLCQRGPYRHLLIKEGDPLPHADVERYRLSERKYWVTTTVDLTVGAERIWKKLKNNAQGPVKQASKQGIQVKLCSDERDMDIFYDLFLENRRSLGTPAFPRSFFTRIWRAFHPAGKAVLMLACKEDLAIGGILLLVHKQTVIDGYAAARPEYRGYRPNDLLVWKAIEWAAGHGCHIFDFGADSPKQDHLLSFKRKWTGIHKDMYHYVYLHRDRTYEEMDNSNEKYLKIRSGIARLPKPVFRIFSDLMVARFG